MPRILTSGVSVIASSSRLPNGAARNQRSGHGSRGCSADRADGPVFVATLARLAPFRNGYSVATNSMKLVPSVADRYCCSELVVVR